MSRAGVLLAVIILPALVFAQNATQPNPQAPVKPEDLCSVEGVISNALTGDPIKNISVTLQPLGGRADGSSALTDVSGRFAFRDLAPGRYILQSAAFGSKWVNRRPGHGGTMRVLTLEPGRHVRDIIIRLQPGGVITGTIYDEDGQPVVDAQVEVFPAAHGSAGGYNRGAQTNDMGVYRIYGLPAGKYYVVARGNMPFVVPVPTDDVYLTTLYPGTADLGQAVAIDLQPGEEQQGIDMTLIRMHGVTVRCHLALPEDAKSGVGAFAQLMPREIPPGLPPVFTQFGGVIQDGQGNFEFHGVPPGAYFIVANGGDQKGFYHGQVAIDVGSENVDGLTVPLAPGYRLTGKFEADSGVPINFTTLNIYLEPAAASGIPEGGVKIQPDGRFEIEHIFDGDYRLHVAGFPEDFYVKSAKWGGADVLASGLTISGDTAGGSLLIHLALDGGRVEGTVLHNQTPAPGALVALVPDPPNRTHDELYSQAVADSLGRFSMRGLPPGDFKLFAWEAGDDVSYRDPDLMKDYDPRGTHIHIEIQKQQNVQLELIPADDEGQ